jgi:glutamyl-tRNA reductase
LLAVGLSHQSAPVSVLERAAVGADAVNKLLGDVAGTAYVDEAVVLATCNRVEVYAHVTKFHSALDDISALLATYGELDLDELTPYLYVHYDNRVARHLFAVAAGLDSMVVGEQQILGQLRGALNQARSEGTIARSLGPVVDNALRVGKRAHSETGIDKAGRSIVSAAVDHAAASLSALDSARALVVGAGAMSTLAATELAARGVGSIVVVNRTLDRGARLAQQVGGRALPIDDLASAVADADVVVSCTGALGVVVSAEVLSACAGRNVVVLDLAMPRDVDPAAREVPGVTVVDLDILGAALEGAQVAREVDSVRRIVHEEVGGYLARQRADRVAPTVVALRERAQQVVDAEMSRLLGRLPNADERTVGEIRQTVERVVDKLLHAPTVRVKELAEAPGGDSYAEVLRELFALNPSATEAVARAAVVVEEETTS